MQTEQYCIAKIKEQRILPLFYHDDGQLCIAVLKTLYSAGIKVVEFTNRGQKALANFKLLVKERDAEMPDLLLGIGTIKSANDASDFIDAGADLLISPVFDSAVCDVAYMQKILWIPACMTPSEIQVAASAGCTMIKLFPGNVLGTGFTEAIKPVFPDLDFLVTGGVEVTEENMRAWFKSGVCAVGLGSKLISKGILEQKNYAAIESLTKKALQIAGSLQQVGHL